MAGAPRAAVRGIQPSLSPIAPDGNRMTPVELFELVLLLLAVVIPLELGARRLGLPPAAALIVGGMALALVPWDRTFTLDPDLTLVLFLPPLLAASAYFTVWRDFRADLRIILQLAIGAVAFTTLIVGIVAHAAVPGLPWAACFALGAIVSPPDAVAAKAVLARVSLPARVMVLLEGESLVNDASGLVLFRFAVVAAMTGAFNIADAAGSFVLVSAGGLAVGVLFGFIVSFLASRMRAHVSMVVITTLLAAWFSYIGAEAIGVSGVLSTVACGLVLGWRQHEVLSAVARTHAKAVWEVVVFVLESLVFILIGLSLRSILQRLGSGPIAISTLAPAVGWVVLAVVVSRFVWIFPSTYLPRWLIPALRRRDPYPPIGVPLIMSWAGMRGVVSLAAALALPADMPGRDFILLTTFAVIRLFRLQSFPQTQPPTLSQAEARALLAEAQLGAVRDAALSSDGQMIHPRLLSQYEYRATASRRYVDANGGLEGARKEHFAVILSALAAARAELLRLHRTSKIHDQVLHALEQELDLEEMTARRHRGEEQH
jgi:Na+/H+ antiporter